MKPKKNLKTMTIYIKNREKVKLFDIMCNYSKKIYNTSLYCFNILKLFQPEIYKKFYKKLKREQIANNEFSYNNIFSNIFNKYHKLYSNNFGLCNKNNDIIYEHIKNELNNTILSSQNIDGFKIRMQKEAGKMVQFDADNKKMVLCNIVDNVIMSFYNKQFFTTKAELLSHKPLSYNDGNLINDVKNDNYHYKTRNKKYNKYKRKIAKKLNIEVKSEQNMLKYVVYNHHLLENKDKLPADIIGNIIDKFYTSIKSYYGLIKKKIKANKPGYQKNKFGLFYFCRSFKIIKNNIRLTVGENISANYCDINGKLTKISSRKYFHTGLETNNIKDKKDCVKVGDRYVHKSHIKDMYYCNLRLPKKLAKKKISLVEIVPYNYYYKAIISYEEEIVKNVNQTEDRISVDLGKNNFMVIYDPYGEQHIIKGSGINNINHYFNKKIDNLKSVSKKPISKRLEYLYNKRERQINAELDCIVNVFYNKYKTKKQIIIGYNEGWKTGINLGKKTNRYFYEIPFCRFINKLQNKFPPNTITKIEESFTSKCDSLSLELLKKKDNYNGTRIKRGLYKCQNGKCVNADLNGAINIMRKLVALTAITGKNLYNPTILKIHPKS